MGAIQGAINGAIGSAAVVVGAGKHIKTEQEHAEAKKLEAAAAEENAINQSYNELIDIYAKAPGVEKEISNIEHDMGNINKEAKAWSTLEAKTPEDEQAKQELKQEIDANEKKAVFALGQAKAKSIAMNRQLQRIQIVLERAQNKGLLGGQK